MLKFIPLLFLMACASYEPWSPPLVTECGTVAETGLTSEQAACLRPHAVHIEDNIPTWPSRFDPGAGIMKALSFN